MRNDTGDLMDIKNLKQPFYDIEINKDIFLTEENIELTIQEKVFKTKAK